jgi:hypothetical protein
MEPTTANIKYEISNHCRSESLEKDKQKSILGIKIVRISKNSAYDQDGCVEKKMDTR